MFNRNKAKKPLEKPRVHAKPKPKVEASRYQQLDTTPKVEDPKDKRIRELTETLIFLKENAVQGNEGHVKRIDGVLGEIS